jgi:P-type Cu2+ transporter
MPKPGNSETWVLDVEGMMCASCAGAVEKILTNSEGVLSATVNLVTEVAAITGTSQANPEAMAAALTAAGYPSKRRAAEGISSAAAEADWIGRQEVAQKNYVNQLAIASLLLILSTLGHLQHLRWGQHLSIPILSTLWFHGLLATLTLAFPARKIFQEGWQGARRGLPNMNTLVSLGALSTYSTSLAALIFPGLGWACFFDEPVMLLSFILLGRTLEQRAKFQAAKSLRSLIALQPTLARLVPEPKLSTPATTEPLGVQIPANQVQTGEWLQVLPSEKIPVDGIIALGQTTVDESMLTGESFPVTKQPGDAVVAGSLNQSGAITLQVSRTGANTTLAQMIRMVESAQTRKAPIQGLADVISGYFTYGILAFAFLTFVFWYFIGIPHWPEVAQIAFGSAHHMAHQPMAPMADAMPHSMAHAMPPAQPAALRSLVSLKLAIAVLVVACPCALGLATPMAILVGSGIGAQQGLLLRGGDSLEATQTLDTIVFDKTGTLTTGKAQLSDCQPVGDLHWHSDELLQLAATVESGTRHPLGSAIQQAAAAKGLALLPAQDFLTQPGFGISAQVTIATIPESDNTLPANDLPTHNPTDHEPSTHKIVVGNAAWMAQNDCQIAADATQFAQALGQAGKSAVFIAQDRQVVGVMGVADSLRTDAIETVRQLRSLGLEVQMLSGDSLTAATLVAQQLGLSAEQVRAEVTPQGKVEAIAALQKAGRRVGLVGDGINDAPALAQADVGISLHSGTDVAIETADIVLMGDSLTSIPAAIQLSRATLQKIRQNLAWAFTYNLVCVPLAAGLFLPTFGLSLNPGLAGGLMALSSVIVVLNSLLLKRQFQLNPAG